MARIERSNEPTVLIVGAGMTGLMAAAALPEYGHRVTLLDKGRSVGGRLATRKIGAGWADHGAQYFTARTPEFQRWVERWRQADIVTVWAQEWSEAGADSHTRYIAVDGMKALAKRLAAEVSASGGTVHTGVRVQAISTTDKNWWVCTDDGRVYQGRMLVLACPVPQALSMLSEGGVSLDSEDKAALEGLRYAPCIALMVAVDGPVSIPEPGAVHRQEGDIPWIADNRRKGISPNATVLTLHAGPDLSRRLYDAADEAVLEALLPALTPYLGAGANVRATQVKRWRYALPEVVHSAPFLQAHGLPPLFVGGDAFGGPRVEGAALSGLAIAGELRALLEVVGVQPEAVLRD